MSDRELTVCAIDLVCTNLPDDTYIAITDPALSLALSLPAHYELPVSTLLGMILDTLRTGRNDN